MTYSCWLWRGFINNNGYSYFSYEGKNIRAHRFSYELFEGEIPDTLTVDHLCRVKNCVNPAHLQLTTNRDNVMRGNGVGVINSRKTHCPQGHRYSEENTYVKKHGRECRICRREFGRRRRALNSV